MARGLSDNQKTILKIVNDMPVGGSLKHINGMIKAELYPDLYGKRESVEYTSYPTEYPLIKMVVYRKKPYGFKQGIGYGKVVNSVFHKDHEGYFQYQKKMNNARVAINKAVNSLIRRGLLEKQEEITSFFYADHFVSEKKRTFLYITQSGKDKVKNT